MKENNMVLEHNIKNWNEATDVIVIGSRFVNELSDCKTLSDQSLSIGHPCIGIAASKAVK